MRNQSRKAENRFRPKPSLLLGLLIAVAMIFAGPAAADQGHKHGARHHHGKHHVKHHGKHHGKHYVRQYHYGYRPVPAPPVVRRPVRVAVPTVIRAPGVEYYRPYYRGRVFHEPHGHHHAIYHFPVYRDDRRYYEPHYYCNGHLYRVNHVAYAGPHFSFSIAF